VSALLGRVRGADPGPTLVLVGGMHGNEPAGVDVCRRFFDRLRSQPIAGGEIVAYAGNPPALAAGRRYLLRDMNRQWTPKALEAMRTADGGADPESAHLVWLANELDAVLANARGPVFALDLHTTSAHGVPFSIVGPSRAQRDFAAKFAIPGVAGISERIPGTLSGYLTSRDCTAIAIEGGQHESAGAIANLEAIVTVALSAAGFLAPADLPGFAAAHARLVEERGALPPLIEVVARHAVRPDSGFLMEPGFINIQGTAAGTLLAREAGAEIRAPFDGFVLLPLYQALGEDGFFYGRELHG
jgi:predicted deacylase